MIRHESGVSVIEEVLEDKVGDSEVLFLHSLLVGRPEYFESITSLCLWTQPITHVLLWRIARKRFFLYTMVVGNDVAGCGVPVSFMFTNLEARRPLVRWLFCTKRSLQLQSSIIFMIGYSATEMAAIQTVFNDPQIRLCH